MVAGASPSHEGSAVPITRRHLQLSLAVLWLFDGILQCQPYMFSRNFARGILMPASQGQPHFVAAPLHAATNLVLAQPVLTNAVFALTQIGLGVLLLTRRHARWALLASIVWALGVWFFGEGLGGIVAGATLLSGAPGAAVLYAILAALAWPSGDHDGDERPSWLALPAWSLVWLTGAGLQLVAGNNSSKSFTMSLGSAASGSPHWLSHIDQRLAHVSIPAAMAAGVVAIFVLVALWALVPGWTRHVAVGLGLLMSLVGWFLFQGLGNLTSGRATDPNSGPLMILLALVVLSAQRRSVPTWSTSLDARSEQLLPTTPSLVS